MAKVNTKTTNQVLFDNIRDLKKLSNKTGVNVYRAVAERLAAPASQRPEVNVSKIQKVVNDGETIVVPGKVLGTGSIEKKVTVVAFSASAGAIEKIEKAGGKVVTIVEFLKKPTNKIRIIG